jgi:hypothetical protein
MEQLSLVERQPHGLVGVRVLLEVSQELVQKHLEEGLQPVQVLDIVLVLILNLVEQRDIGLIGLVGVLVVSHLVDKQELKDELVLV